MLLEYWFARFDPDHGIVDMFETQKDAEYKNKLDSENLKIVKVQVTQAK